METIGFARTSIHGARVPLPNKRRGTDSPAFFCAGTQRPFDSPDPANAISLPAPQPEPHRPHLGGIGAVDVRVQHRVGQAEDEEDVGEARVHVVHGALGGKDEPAAQRHLLAFILNFAFQFNSDRITKQ